MSIELILFYLFSSFALVSAIMVIGLSNAVHSVLFLILVFCNVAGLLLLLGAEFLAFLFLIVYVGAIAVLFLFVVMMLNIKTTVFKASSWSIFPIGLTIFLSFIFQFIAAVDINFETIESIYNIHLSWINWIVENNSLSNIEVVGSVLYTRYSFIFVTSGFILLIAMIGAIVLTMHQRSDVKKQLISIQLIRNPLGVIKFVSLRK
jgi:NADH-quinone oxidoreductase subunit J